MYYTLSSISYVFPFDTTKYLINSYQKSEPSNEQLVLCGVLAPYIKKKMTEKEADELLSEIIMRHPFIKGAMSIEIQIQYHTNQTTGYYQILTIKNFGVYGKESKPYRPTPIQWRQD